MRNIIAHENDIVDHAIVDAWATDFEQTNHGLVPRFNAALVTDDGRFAEARDTDEAHLLAEAVLVRAARCTLAADHQRLHDDVVAHGEALDAPAELGDRAGELVDEDHRQLLTGERVRLMTVVMGRQNLTRRTMVP